MVPMKGLPRHYRSCMFGALESLFSAVTPSLFKGNALLRIGDVLRFSPVAVSVGAGSTTLSYQKGYFPILEVCLKPSPLFSSDHLAS
jgi:hypothetical protein